MPVPDDDDRIAYLEGLGGEGLDAAERAQLDELTSALADPSAWYGPAPSLEDRVVAAVRQARAAGTEAPAGQPVAPSPGAAPGRSGWRPGRRLVGLAAAAAVAVLAGLVGFLAGGAGGGGDGRPEPSFEVALAGTDLAPGVAGTATLAETTSGWEVRLDVPGLARLGDGRYYQAWLRDEAGVLVPIGSFNEGRDVVLWAGVGPHRFPTLTVTVEAADGEQGSSGQRVLVGEARPTGGP